MEQTTKTCKHCGRELPLSEFYHNSKSPDRKAYWCKDCMRQHNAAYYAATRRKKSLVPTNANPETYYDERTKGLTPADLIEELRKRGFTGELRFVEIKTHNIKL